MLRILHHVFKKRPCRRTILVLPNEIILQIAENLAPNDLNSLLRSNSFLARVLSPMLLDRAISSTTGKFKRSVLHWASSQNHKDLAIQLLARGANVNTPDNRRMTALHSAIVLGYGDIVKLLLENGADTETRNIHGWTPLLSAAISGNYTAARYLLDHQADIESTGHNYLYNALHYAAAFGEVAIASLLVDRGCNIEATEDGLNTIQIAAIAGQEEVVSHLLGRGFSPGTYFGLCTRLRSKEVIGRAWMDLQSTLAAEYSGNGTLSDAFLPAGGGFTTERPW